MRKKWITWSVFVIFVGVMIAVDVSGEFSYWGRSLIKVSMFGLIPALFLMKSSALKSLFTRGNHLKAVLVGCGVIVIGVFVGYLVLDQFNAFDTVTSSLNNQVGVSVINYPLVFVYVVFINGPLEEYFFRHVMMARDSFSSVKGRALMSSFLFAIYHVGMLFTMFSLPLFLAAIAGLMIVGLFFVWVNQRNDGILYSTLLHMAANLAINSVGAIILFAN